MKSEIGHWNNFFDTGNFISTYLSLLVYFVFRFPKQENDCILLMIMDCLNARDRRISSPQFFHFS